MEKRSKAEGYGLGLSHSDMEGTGGKPSENYRTAGR